MSIVMAARIPKPPWLRVRAPGGARYHELRGVLRASGLNTVCEHARCPNVGTCWREGTATVMLLGERCTRHCRFCAVAPGAPGGVVDEGEPGRVAEAVAGIGLDYVVLTMVTRDDLPDGGAAIVARTIELIHQSRPGLLVEALVSDFGGCAESIDRVVDARPAVFAHNVEVTRSQSAVLRDRRTSFDRSLSVLTQASARAPAMPTKSSIMVGVGESDTEVVDTLRELRSAGVSLVTIGQYLQPSPAHHPVARFVTPEQFQQFREAAEQLGFAHVASGPLVRSSYRAAELYVKSIAERGRGASR